MISIRSNPGVRPLTAARLAPKKKDTPPSLYFGMGDSPFPEIGNIEPIPRGTWAPKKIPRAPTAAAIKAAVCHVFRVSENDLISPRRSREIAWPRQAGYLLCKELTVLSLPQIGLHFGKRDHTTIIDGLKKAQKRTETNHIWRAQVDLCRKLVRG